MPTAQATDNLQLLQDIDEARYDDIQLDVLYDEQRKWCIFNDTARAVIRLYASRGIALHHNMTDDMLRSCFYEYAGAEYVVQPYQIEVIRSMIHYK